MMADSTSPLVLRRRLRTALRNARQEKNLTQEQVAAAMVWSPSKVIRIENAASSISVNDVKALLQLYGITDEKQKAELVALAREARKRTWWRSYSHVAPSSLIGLIDYESAASSVRQFEITYIPGSLQTEEYAHAVLDNFYGDTPDAEGVAALVELRTKRWDQLNREDAPQFSFILDEPVIHRLVGGPSVMRRQLRRLSEVAELPNVTIEIVPLSVGLHPGTSGPFEIIQLADASDEYVVYLEGARNELIDDPNETQRYLERFKRIKEASLGPTDSAPLLRKIADEMM
jgi:transcriptional regulator with XRE-family HTH domain